MAESTKRVFVSLSIPTEVKDNITKTFKQIPGLHIHPTDNFHVTIKFIGDADSVQLTHIESLLDFTSHNFHNFDVHFDRLKIAESRLRLVVANPESIFSIRATIEHNLKKINLVLPEKMEFYPHITLGKIAPNTQIEDRLFDYSSLSFNANHFTLYETLRGEKAAIFQPLQKFSLLED